MPVPDGQAESELIVETDRPLARCLLIERMKMADDRAVAPMKINAETTDGKVTLNGRVENSAEADKAVGLARSVDGVKERRVQPRRAR